MSPSTRSSRLLLGVSLLLAISMIVIVASMRPSSAPQAEMALLENQTVENQTLQVYGFEGRWQPVADIPSCTSQGKETLILLSQDDQLMLAVRGRSGLLERRGGGPFTFDNILDDAFDVVHGQLPAGSVNRAMTGLAAGLFYAMSHI